MVTLPGTQRDAVTLSRQAGTVDTEGNSVGGFETVWQGRGTWGSPNATDRLRADRQGQVLDAVCVIPSSVEVKPGDRLEVRGTWTVVAVESVRFHSRVFLRRAE